MKSKVKTQIGGNSFRNGIAFNMDDTIVKTWYEGDGLHHSIQKKSRRKGAVLWIYHVLAVWFLTSLYWKIYVISIIAIIGYLFFLRLTITSKYHGAEHKTINTYSNDKDLTVSNVKSESRVSIKCGINYALYFMIYSLPSVLIPYTTQWHPIFALGLSIAIVSIYLTHSRLADLLLYPVEKIGGFVQLHLSTREPEDWQIELALSGIKNLLNSREYCIQE